MKISGHFHVYQEPTFEEAIEDLKAEVLKVLPGMEKQAEEFLYAILSSQDGIILLSNLDDESALNLVRALTSMFECCSAFQPVGNLADLNPQKLAQQISNPRALNFALFTNKNIFELEYFHSLVSAIRDIDENKHLLILATTNSVNPAFNKLPESIQSQCLAEIDFEKFDPAATESNALCNILPVMSVDKLMSIRREFEELYRSSANVG